MLYAHEEIVVLFALTLVDETAELLLDVLGLSRVLEVVLFHSHGIQNHLVLSRLQVPFTEDLDLA